MKIEDALRIGDLSKGSVAAGQEGLSNEILSIEVMEVPEVGSWISKGILMMTTFYSIRENPEKQIEVVTTLIEKEAAGIVVKLGRFVEGLPKKMIEIANEHSFPIIVIPKDVSYINVLTPLYERLYEEKKSIMDQTANPFSDFENSDFSTVENALNYLSDLTDSAVYIEDIEGKLLYVSSEFQSDKWRTSRHLFSEPEYESFSQMLERWRIDFQTNNFAEFKIDGQRSRYIIPLVSKSKVFGIIHLLHKDQEIFTFITDSHISSIGTEMAELVLKEQLLLQKEKMRDIELLSEFSSADRQLQEGEKAIVIYLKANTSDLRHYPRVSLLDYSCIYHRKLREFSKKMNAVESIIFEKYQHYYALVFYKDDHYQQVIGLWREGIEVYGQKYPKDQFRIAFSQSFDNPAELDERTRSAVKIMEIGLKIRPDESVYSHDKLGIYDILFGLTEDSKVINYAEMVLGEIMQKENELYESLKMYLDENGNVSKTAEKLFVHRRTMTYRIQRIQELLMMDLDNAEHRFILQFCIKIKELK
ncbi:PucR family transcriptional regulator [Planococcus sp. SE5232]|uniref:PucR family transcriptional regulator n=1 Tax=unclassified Planococcus (in: firmicutes) TaxID=2662419 RepID=UPI003D6C58D5